MTEDASQVELVTIALYLAGGQRHVTDTEDIAVKVHELAPGRFSWRKYPDQINLELVRVYLSAAKDPIRGAYVMGTGRSGWTLTPVGLEWAKTNSERLLRRDLTRARSERRGGSIDEQRWQRERARITNTAAWTHWLGQRSTDISEREAAEVFRIDSYAVGRTRDLKIARLREMFDDDPELGPFVRALIPAIQEKEE